jgi:uncharacterized protein (DUF433 family)
MLSISAQPLPLAKDENGTIRVLGSRVTLDTIVATYEKGATPEEIILHYPTLNLADVYSILGYYLHNRTEVNEYLAEQKEQAANIRQKIEDSSSISEIRERLLTRQNSKNLRNDASFIE